MCVFVHRVMCSSSPACGIDRTIIMSKHVRMCTSGSSGELEPGVDSSEPGVAGEDAWRQGRMRLDSQFNDSAVYITPL